MSLFAPASKTKSKLRLALAGPAGSGKTYTALQIAVAIATSEGGKPAVIDTENGSASKYADLFGFDAATLSATTGFSPEAYLELIHGAEKAGYPVIVIDSLSHEWAGPDGILQAVDQAATRVSGNKFVAWGQVTPRHDKLVRAIVESPVHIIVTLRAKMEYVQERNERGRTEIRAVGMKPIQRDELEYEFDVYGLLDQDNTLVIRKSRCPNLSGAVISKPGKDVSDALITWLSSGEEAPTQTETPFDASTPAGGTPPVRTAGSATSSAPAMNDTPAPTPHAAPAASEDAGTTPDATPATSSTPSTTATDAEQRVHDSAVLTGAPETTQDRWARLVKEAEHVNLATLGAVKAIDPSTVPENQLAHYAKRLEERLEEARAKANAA